MALNKTKCNYKILQNNNQKNPETAITSYPEEKGELAVCYQYSVKNLGW